MSDLGFLGLRATNDFTVTGERPKNWREGIMRLYPNGMAPLTALTAMMGSEAVDDPEFSWFQKELPDQGGAVTDIFTDSIGGTSYVTGGTAGDTLHVQVAAVRANECKAGHIVQLRDASDPTMTVNALVTSVTVAGANSDIFVTILEDDDNGVGDLSDCDVFEIIGSAYEEGAERPDSVSYDPTRLYNYTQIFRNSLDQTRTAMKTRLRTGDQYKEAKREALELHSIEMEKAYLFGIPYETTGTGGKPLRTTGGLHNFIQTNAAGNVVDFAVDNSGETWLSAGKAWLDEKLETLFRYGDSEKLAFVGSGALLGINKLAEVYGHINISPETTAFGMKVGRWITPFGELVLKTHPLFSYKTEHRNSMTVFEPKRLKYRHIDDTFFKKDDRERKGGGTGADKRSEEFLTEAGLEFHFAKTGGIFRNVGIDG